MGSALSGEQSNTWTGLVNGVCVAHLSIYSFIYLFIYYLWFSFIFSFLPFASLRVSTRSGNILSFLLPLFQEGQLSVTGESMCTKYWLTA